MITNYDDVKQLNSERLRESNRDKAEKYKAVSEADRINSWNRFKLVHSGAAAIARNDVYWSCQANEDLIELFLYEEELPITLETLEFAFKENRKRLAPPPNTTYERKAKSEYGKFPQLRSFPPETKIAPYTKEEILSFGPSQMRAAMKKFGSAELNRILAN